MAVEKKINPNGVHTLLLILRKTTSRECSSKENAEI